MSSIKTTYGKDGNPSFRVRVKRNGVVRSKTFHTTYAEAEAWGLEQETEMRDSEAVDMLGPLTIGDLIDALLSEVPACDQARGGNARGLSDLTPDKLTSNVVLETFPDMGVEALFLEYVLEYGRHNGVFLSRNPVSAARQLFDKLPFRPVADSEIELLIAKAEANENGYFAALLSVIMDGALKQVEALRVRRQHIDVEREQLKFDGRCVPLRPQALELLTDRIKLVDSDELFSSVTVKQSQSRLSDYCNSIGIDPVKFPDLRREGAYRLCVRYGFTRAWEMLGNPSTANSAWMIVAAERNRPILNALGPLPDFIAGLAL